MITHRETNTLIHALHDLFLKVSNFELVKRVSAYHHKSVSALDISAPLSKHIDKLVVENRRTKSRVANAVTSRSSAERKLQKIVSASSKPSRLNKMLDGLARHYKRSAGKTESNQYMGERLKSSTWSHLHVASMEARRGNVAAAKIHADIANQALKEAVNYMSDEEYEVFSGQVNKVVNEG